MNQKTFMAVVFAVMLSACSTIDDLTVNESYDLTFHPEEEAYIDWYLETLDNEQAL
jgi:ABC-type uncharacterized transport system auxiliary subunit|tara:strand:+ start:261 stop:428 length:168 start_codon:yes stop_codon:yes gene_type:complete